jgi:hypothetical protein
VTDNASTGAADASKLARRAVGSVLLTEADTRDAISDAVHSHIERVATQAEQRHTKERHAAMLALLLAGAKAMAEDVRIAILSGREDARNAARGRLHAEMVAAGIALEAHHWAVGARSEEDAAHAASSADSLAAQWRGMAMVAALRAHRREMPVSEAIDLTRGPMKARIERTAASETAQAYNDEHLRSAREIADFDRKFRDGELAERIVTSLGRQWSALVDACERCIPLDGEIVGLYESFSGGEEPGYVHAHCRCVEIIVPLEATSARAA